MASRLPYASTLRTVRAMTPRKPKQSAAAATVAVSIRGMTAVDLDAVDRAIARRLRTAPPGAQLSRNAVMIAVLRDALAREDAADTDASRAAQ